MLSVYEDSMNNLQKEEETQEVEIEVQQEDLFKEEPRVESTEVSVESPQTEQRQHVSDSKQRIDRLTKKMREAERREQDAIAFAQAKMAENDDLKVKLTGLDKDYVSEYGQRVDSDIASVKESLRKAMSIGDTDAVVDAQEKIASLMVAKERATQAKVKIDREENSQPQETEPQPQSQPQTATPQQKPDPKAEAWAQKNEWFGTDEAMTYAAFGIHKKLVETEGFDPRTDEYYNELDKQLVETFPTKLGTNSQRQSRPVQTVASASRTANSGRKTTVRLTTSQVAMAKKLGVPLEEYAKYVKE
tara:strand:- start:8656 stop:9564 length:909 start_codon:yes stop_codon:yes gene_type:complete